MPTTRPLFTKAVNLTSNWDYWAHRTHALLGFYTLSHFLYRYGLFFFLHKTANHDMGFNAPAALLHATETDHWIQFAKWFLPHLLLQCTGFLFPLPIKRHPDGNRIWPQYRWEALVFCARCISLSFIAWRRKLHNLTLDDGSCSIVPSTFCVGLTMVSADWISHWYRSTSGAQCSRTIRDLTAPRWVQYLMSSAQFHATTHCLLTSNRLSVQIAALTVVQLSAFGMTLRRKGFISQKGGVVLYALVLVMGMIVIIDDLKRRSILNVAMIFGNSSAVLRMYLGLNKYIMWLLVVAVFTFMLKHDLLNDDVFPLSFTAMIASWLILVSTCYLKHRTR